MAEAALERLEELLDEDWVHEDTAERLRGMYSFRRERFRSRFDLGSDGSVDGRLTPRPLIGRGLGLGAASPRGQSIARR